MKSERFKECLNHVSGSEGGYSNHKADRGGATNYGITQRTYDRYRQLMGLSLQRVSEIEPYEVEDIYREYWKDSHADQLPRPLDLAVFDCAVNSGAGRAIKLLQRALGFDESAVDGLWGRVTSRAVAQCDDVSALYRRYLDERRSWYDEIIERDPSQAVFAKGWMRRVDMLEEEIA